METVTVPSQNDLETAINSYVAQGYVVSNKTATSAVLMKKKQFSIGIGIVGFLLCFIGLIIYAVVYSMQKDKVVTIKVK
jgi:hypothetical protein